MSKTATSANPTGKTVAHGNGASLAQPQYQQGGKEIQAFGTVMRMPLALDEKICAAMLPPSINCWSIL